MKENEVPVTLTSFPRLGAPGVFTDPYYEPGGDAARSLFLPDEITNPHVRFPYVARRVDFGCGRPESGAEAVHSAGQDPHGQHPAAARLDGRHEHAPLL